jgi:hypothetical protein
MELSWSIETGKGMSLCHTGAQNHPPSAHHVCLDMISSHMSACEVLPFEIFLN